MVSKPFQQNTDSEADIAFSVTRADSLRVSLTDGIDDKLEVLVGNSRFDELSFETPHSVTIKV